MQDFCCECVRAECRTQKPLQVFYVGETGIECSLVYPAPGWAPGGSQSSEGPAYPGAPNSEDGNWGCGFKSLRPAWCQGSGSLNWETVASMMPSSTPQRMGLQGRYRTPPFPHLACEQTLHREVLHFASSFLILHKCLYVDHIPVSG